MVVVHASNKLLAASGVLKVNKEWYLLAIIFFVFVFKYHSVKTYLPISMYMPTKSAFEQLTEIISVPGLPPPPPAQVQTVPGTPSGNFLQYFSQEEAKKIEAVAATLVLEAGGEGRKGMEAVYEVIHNRAHKRHKSLYEVVVAPKQFSCFNSGVDQGIARAKKHPKWNVAMDILKSPLTNHTHGADHYHTHNVHPSWGRTLVQRGARTLAIGGHLFYYN